VARDGSRDWYEEVIAWLETWMPLLMRVFQTLQCAERLANKVHGFSTGRSVVFALCSVLSCRMRAAVGAKSD
jgi:hypothetical protein